MLLLDCSVTLLLEATTLEEDCFTSSLLLDLASEEEDGFTEELDSFAFSSDELEFFESLEDEDWRSPLEVGMTEEEEDFDFSTDEEDLPLSALFCELEEFLEIFSLLELASLQSSLCSSHWRGSGETEEEDSCHMRQAGLGEWTEPITCEANAAAGCLQTDMAELMLLCACAMR